MKKVLYLTNIPAPYTVAFFNELGKKVNLTVLFERKSANNRNKLWTAEEKKNYKEVFLSGINMFHDTALCFSVLKYLKKCYDFIVVGGYSTPTGILAITYMNLKKIPFLISADGGFAKDDNNLKRKFKTFLISRAEAWFSSGNVTTDYLMHYGAKKENIYTYPFTSIMESEITEREEDPIRGELKRQLGVKEEQMVLSVGSYIYRKGYDILIKAMSSMPHTIGVYIVGGKPTEEYIQWKKQYGLKNLHFIDFQKKEALALYYRAADLFVLPTREDIWGLVINEAMSYGLPIVTTKKCVAGLELVEDGKNGFLVRSEDVQELSDRMTEVLENRELSDSMSANSLKVIRNYTIEKMAQRYFEIFEQLT